MQRAYEELQRDGFIETEVGRGTFVSGVNKEFYREEQQKIIEDYLQKAILIAKENAISSDEVIRLIKILFSEEN